MLTKSLLLKVAELNQQAATEYFAKAAECRDPKEAEYLFALGEEHQQEADLNFAEAMGY